MQVTKYPQSHLIVSNGTNKIIIDSGSVTFAKGFKTDDFKGADGYLFTHIHPDHLDPDHVKEVVGEAGVYGNKSVAEFLRPLGINVTEVANREEFRIGTFTIKAIDLPHCKMEDGTDGPPNTGFLIDGVLFHPGDGDKSPGDVTSENMALPIAGPTITLDGAIQFAKEVQAKVVIPIHNDYYHNDENQFAQMAKDNGLEVRLLNPGEATEI